MQFHEVADQMPIYEYECTACGHTLDALQKLSDPPLQDCPACGRPDLRKRVSAPRFRLKGGGWYETDFKQENRRNIAETGEGKSASEPAGEKSPKAEPATAKADTAAKSESPKKEKSTGKAEKPKASSGDA
jgi:putative FmdB family regulatory protein